MARVGLAVSDELGAFAHPRAPLDGRNRKALLSALLAFCKDEGIERFVVGLPLEMTGERGPAAERVITFAEQLANTTGREVELIDERLSTVQASRALDSSGVKRSRRKQQIDAAAAVVILQTWLDGRRG